MTSTNDTPDANPAEEACEDQLTSPPASKRNAFSELMSPKAKQSKPSKPAGRHSNPADPRNNLLPYILQPSKFPADVVIAHNENTVLVRDAYPKATVHLLLLPRDSSKWSLNPRDAFDDEAFLAMVRKEADAAVRLAASELFRLISPHSASCEARLRAMEEDDPPQELPPARDFSQDLKVGIHAHPSMSHLHVHIVSQDMHSDRLKHQKHYNSFNTGFFIPLKDFPLAKDDPRRQTSYQNANLKADYTCWRCAKKFGNKFTQLKAHLEEEFKAWRAD
jgi:aprataxin